jgi:hypothetical protein
MDRPLDILIVESPVAAAELDRLVRSQFGDMVKYVVDVRRGIIAIGGEMHADAEQRLLDHGSQKDDLWGANYYPGRGPQGCIEYTSLINISPRRGNRSMEIQEPSVRVRVREVTFALIGRGEEQGWPPSTTE